MTVKINYIILLILLTSLQNMESAVVNIGNQQSYFLNNNFASDTNIKFLSFCNEMIMAHTNSDIQFKILKYEVDSTKYAYFKMKYILPDTGAQMQINERINRNELLVDINDSTFSPQNQMWYKKLVYNNLYPQVNFSCYVKQNKLNFNFDIKDISSIEKIKFQFIDLDSLKVNTDSSITIFTKNGELGIARVHYLQYDTLSCDTAVKPVIYSVNNDTLMLKFLSIDSTKNIITVSDKNDSSFTNNVYYHSYLSQGNLNEKSLSCYVDEYKTLYSFNMSENYSTYKWGNYSSTLGVVYQYKYNKYYLQQNNNKNEVSLTKQLFFSKDSNQIEFVKMIRTPKNELIVIGNTKSELKGEFKQTHDSGKYSRVFTNDKYNGFIMMLNTQGKCYYANYINFDSTDANVRITDISNIDGDLYITGIVDSLTNTGASYYNMKYNKTKPYKTFITDYQWRDSTSHTMIISSSNINEYLMLNNGILRLDTNMRKELVFIGTTNSTSLLDTTLWKKVDNTNDNIIISFSTNLDSIYKTYKFAGNLNEGLYTSIDSFHLNKTFINYLNDSLIYMNLLSNSNIFYNNSYTYTKNIKDNSNYNCVNVALNYQKNNIDKLLIINSEEDQKIAKTIFADTCIYLVLNSVSKTYTQPIINDSLLTDTITSSNYSKGVIISLNYNLCMSRDIYNNIVYNPLWLTFIENDYSNACINDIAISSAKLYVVGNSKNRTYYSSKMNLYNGNHSSVNDDAYIYQIYLGYLRND